MNNEEFLELFDPRELVERHYTQIDPNKKPRENSQTKNQLNKLSNGALYAGVLAEGKPEGTGLMILGNEDIYYGEFKDGLMHGRGCYQ